MCAHTKGWNVPQSLSQRMSRIFSNSAFLLLLWGPVLHATVGNVLVSVTCHHKFYVLSRTHVICSTTVLHVLFLPRSQIKKQPYLDITIPNTERKIEKYNLAVMVKFSSWKQNTPLPTGPSLMAIAHRCRIQEEGNILNNNQIYYRSSHSNK